MNACAFNICDVIGSAQNINVYYLGQNEMKMYLHMHPHEALMCMSLDPQEVLM